MLTNGIREVPVTDVGGCFVGFIDEAAIASIYIRRTRDTAGAGSPAK
jgi:hypothetical protein